MLKQQHQVFVALFAVADGLVVIGASFAAWGLRRGLIEQTWLPESWEHYAKESLALYTVPVVLLALQWFGLYLPRRDRSLVGEVSSILKACVAGLLALLALLYIFESSIFNPPYGRASLGGVPLDAGRVQLGALPVFLPLTLCGHRLIARAVLRSLRRRGWNLRHVVVIGCGRLGQIVAHTLERNSWTGIKVSYFISHQERTRRTLCADRPVRGGLSELEATLDTHKPDAVYVALPSSRAAQIHDILRRLERFPVDVRIVPDLNPRYLPQSMAVSELDGMPILSYRENPTSGLGGLSKRGLDIVGAAVGLLVFSPVMLATAALVWLTSPGPVIFKQRRVSLGGQTFDIYKFRTMRHIADEVSAVSSDDESRLPARSRSLAPRSTPLSKHDIPDWTHRDDPRITPIGRWLRRTSLDELPQLVNVLVGEMSLVGPRPERPELIQRFREDWRGYMLRTHVKAGITGWAQINGLRGQTSLRKRLQYDLFYVKNWSLGFDLKILLLTVLRGFVHRNAH